MADPVYDLDGFSVGGRTQGTITLPCDGTTQINIAVQMRARLDPGKAAVIPVWIGESGTSNMSKVMS